MSAIEQATTVLEAHGYSVCAEAVAALEKDRDRLLGQRQDQSVEIDALKAALEGVLPFLTGEYWPGVVADAAVDRAIAIVRKVGADSTALVGSNVEFSGTPAASSPEGPLERRVRLVLTKEKG